MPTTELDARYGEPDATAVPSMAKMMWDHVPSVRTFPTVEESAADLGKRLQTLY